MINSGIDQPNRNARFNCNKIWCVCVGDIVKFGTYQQSSSSFAKDKINWIVLDVANVKALLLSEYGLDAKPYFDYENRKAHWEISSLRGWLKGAFFNTAFNNNEKEKIVFYTNGYTQDKVFLLSADEAKKYLTNNDKIKCFATEYAKKVAYILVMVISSQKTTLVCGGCVHIMMILLLTMFLLTEVLQQQQSIPLRAASPFDLQYGFPYNKW